MTLPTILDHEVERFDITPTWEVDYAAAGVGDYWIVDPATERITVLALDGAAYRTHGEFGRGEQATSATLPGFAVEVAAVFNAAQQ